MKNTKKILTATAVAALTLTTTAVVFTTAHASTGTGNGSQVQTNQAESNVQQASNAVSQAKTADDQATNDLNSAQQQVTSDSQAVNQAQQKLQSDENIASQASKAVTSAQNNVNRVTESHSGDQTAKTNRAQVESELNQAKATQANVNSQNADNHLNNAVSEAQASLTSAQSAQQSASDANNQAETSLSAAQQNLQHAGNQDVTTANLINAPQGYRDDFAGGRGLVYAIRPALTYGDHGDPLVFMPQQYAVTTDGVESHSFNELNSYVNFVNQYLENDSDDHLVFIYDDGNQIHQTSDVNVVMQHTDRPVSAWIASTNGLTDPYSTAFQMPISIEYYQYEDGVTPDRYVKYGYAKTWDAVPDNEKATARPVYNTALSYVDNPSLENVNVPDALHLSQSTQAALTEYAANIINHFNAQAGFPGRAVANSVAIQKTNTIAQEQTAPRQHQLDHTQAVGSYGECMYLKALTDTDNVSLNTLFKRVHDGILHMLFPNFGAKDADWGHANTFYHCEEQSNGNPAFTVANPAKLGIAFDQFGNLHFDFYNPADMDFQNSQDYTSVAQTDTTALQAAVTDAQNKATAAQQTLTHANQTLSDAQTALDKAQQALNNWQNDKKAADQKVQDLQTALNDSSNSQAEESLNHAQAALTQAQNSYKAANNQVVSDQNALQLAQARLSQAQAQLTAATANKARTTQALTNAQKALAQAQRGTNTSAPVHDQGALPSNPTSPATNPGTTSQPNTAFVSTANLSSNQEQVANSSNANINAANNNLSSSVDFAQSTIASQTLPLTSNLTARQASNGQSQTNLPQTGNQNSLLVVLLSAVSGLFGLGFAADKKRLD